MADGGPRSVFVTGATGYVGQRVVPALTDAGWHVAALTRQPSPALAGPSVTPVMGDLRTVSSYAGALTGCTAVVHCARSTAPDEQQRAREDVDAAVALWTAAQ